MKTSSSIVLPKGLEQISLARFDDLLKNGDILYESPKIDINDNAYGFQVCSPELAPNNILASR